MKFNRIVLVSILLLIFAIGAVSAADDNMTDTAEEVLSAEPTEDLEVSQGDFAELVGLIKNTSSGKTLILDKDYINDGTYTKGILISKNMTIDGQGHTLDANNKSNIFRISNNQVILKNINFINSYTKDYSAVYGNCTVINCTFTDCITEKNGGALYNGTAYDSSFINCKACYESMSEFYSYDTQLPPYCQGGAIYNGDAHNCYFENCNAELYYYHEFYLEEGCDWIDLWDNSGRGGAISNGNAFNCFFINCRSYLGGAIYYGNAYNCSFENCRADVKCGPHDSTTVGYGGAIYDGDANNCSFTDCYAKFTGGAIYQGNAYNSAFINCTSQNKNIIYKGNSTNSIFIPDSLTCSNLTANYGDDIKIPIRTVEGSNGIAVNVKIYKDNELIKSISSKTGSDLPIDVAPGNYLISLTCDYADSINVSLVVNKVSPQLVLANDYAKSGETANVKVSLSKNAAGYVRIIINGVTYRVQINSGVAMVEVPTLADGAYDVKAIYGGNVYNNPETITGTFHVGKYSQGIILENEDIIGAERLTAHLAKDATGFVRFIVDGETYRTPIENGIAYEDIEGLKTGTYTVTLKYGGNYRYNAETLTKTINVKEVGDFAELQSLVENTLSGKTLKLEKDYVNDNTSSAITISNGITIDGQGHTINANQKSNIYNVENKDVILKNINFINSEHDSAAVYGQCSIYNSTFKNCKYNGNWYSGGGAINQGTAHDCSFVNCTSRGYGGAIYKGNAYNCSFVGCSAPTVTTAGGAIYKGDAYDCSFVNCFTRLRSYGGAIVGNAHNCSFTSCYAGNGGYGGAIYGNAYDCSFLGCYVGKDGYGGAIYGNAYNCSFKNCSIIYGGGGAIYHGDAYCSSFENCTTGWRGGAIYWGNSHNSSFIDCNAALKGGAIYDGNAYDSIFINCSSAKGGIIDDGTHDNCIFSPLTLSCSNLTVNYGEGRKLPIRIIDVNGKNLDGETVNVKIYKGNNIINSFSTKSGTDLPIDAAPGNYIIALTCEYANPLNVSLTVNKGSPKLALANNFAKSGETANVKVTMSKKATGFVKITINGETYRVQINSAVASVDVPNLADGAYTVKATYGGNVYFNAETMTDTFHVGKFNQGIKLTVTNINVGETERITATLANDATGFVRFIIGNDTYKVAIENGVAYVDIKDLKAGSYSVTVKYAGNYKYNAETKAASFTVSKTSPGLTVYKTTVEGKTVLTANLAEDARGNVKFEVNGNTYKAQITGGVATVTLPDMAPGTYTLKTTYAGNYKYLAETKTRSITIK